MSRIYIPTNEEDKALTKSALSDPNNLPLTDNEFKNMKRVRGVQVSPVKKQLSIRVDQDILEALKGMGKGWQTRVNAILRDAMGL